MLIFLFDFSVTRSDMKLKETRKVTRGPATDRESKEERQLLIELLQFVNLLGKLAPNNLKVSSGISHSCINGYFITWILHQMFMFSNKVGAYDCS